MDLALVREHGGGYRSGAQRARRLTEAWVAAQLYCPACPSGSLRPTRPNTPAADFRCPRCEQRYELKAGRAEFRTRVRDAAFHAMIRAIRENRAPNLLLLHYGMEDLRVRGLLVIPRVFIGESAIQRREPLSETARRPGWVGCDILLDRIPADGRIPMIRLGHASDPATVRERFGSFRGLEDLAPESRGWTLDVLRVVRRLGRSEFHLADVYAYERELSALHPRNRYVRDKIRQQLQMLRDLGLLEFANRGTYRLTREP